MNGILHWISLHEHWALLILFAFALGLRLLFLFVVGINDPPNYDGIGYSLLADGLLKGKGYINDWGEPTAFRPPVYPLFLAGIFGFFGKNYAVVRILQAAIDAGTVLILYATAKKLFNLRSAVFTGLGAACYPLLIYMTDQIYPETFSFFLQFAAALLLLQMSPYNWKKALIAGGIMGLVVLARPTATLWVPFILVWLFWPGVLRYPWRFFVALGAGLTLIFAPWIVRNYVVFHAFIPISSLGSNGLWTGNNPLSDGGSVEPGPETWGADDYPDRLWYGWEGISELESGQRFAEKGLAWIRANPVQFLSLIPKKLMRLWSPTAFGVQFSRKADPIVSMIVWPPYLVFLGMGFYGCWLARRQWKEIFPYLAMILAVNILAVIYYGATRYGIPIGLVCILFASLALDRLFLRWSNGYMPVENC